MLRYLILKKSDPAIFAFKFPLIKKWQIKYCISMKITISFDLLNYISFNFGNPQKIKTKSNIIMIIHFGVQNVQISWFQSSERRYFVRKQFKRLNGKNANGICIGSEYLQQILLETMLFFLVVFREQNTSHHIKNSAQNPISCRVYAVKYFCFYWYNMPPQRRVCFSGVNIGILRKTLFVSL